MLAFDDGVAAALKGEGVPNDATPMAPCVRAARAAAGDGVNMAPLLRFASGVLWTLRTFVPVETNVFAFVALDAP